MALPSSSAFLSPLYALAPSSSYRTGYSKIHSICRRPQPAMASDVVALRVAYFSLNLVGGLAMTITFFILCLNFRQTHDGPFLMSIVLCLSRIISTVTSCFLLFFGAMTGSAAPRSVCIAQSGLHASLGPLLAYSILSYALNVLLMVPPSSLLMGTVATATRAGLLLLPLLSFAAVAVVSALLASQNPGNVYIRLFYCFLDQRDIKSGSAILAAIALLATIATIARTLYIMKRKDPPLPASGPRWLEDIVLQIFCLGLYAVIRLGFLGVNTFKPDLAVAADMVDAADGIIIFIILGTQPWIFKLWLNRMSAGAVDVPRRTTDQRHAALLQRVSEYPSVIDIGRRSGSRQGREAQQTPPRLRALNTALGLAANDPYIRYHGSGELEKRATIVEPDFQYHPQSVDDAHNNVAGGSRPSPKSFDYGAVLGNPSRDAGSVRPETVTPNDGRPTSLIIISTPPPGSSSHALHLPLDEDTQGSASERPNRVSLSPLAISGLNLNRPQRRSRGASDSSLPHTPRISFERNRRGQDSPLRALFFGLSTESVSSGISPRGGSRSIRTSSEPPPSQLSMANHRYCHGYGTPNGEGSMYQSASSESSLHILVDDIASSILSWPNVSRSSSQILPDRVNNVATPASGGFSPSPFTLASRWLQYYADSIEEPPHPTFLRETTPSPLSLNEEGSGSVGAHTFGGPSPVERRHPPHPQGLAPSPLRPPGLGSPLYRWKEELEEAAQKESNES